MRGNFRRILAPRRSKAGFSEDLPYFFPNCPSSSCRPVCFCAPRFAKKGGKEHRYWSIVETRRVAGRPLLSRRDQRLAAIGVAQVDRGTGREQPPAAHSTQLRHLFEKPSDISFYGRPS